MANKIRYWSINGKYLLRRIDDKEGVAFSLMSKDGLWGDAPSIGIRYTITGDEAGAADLTAAQAAALAKKLGRKL
jgi:hypothetical protein